MKLGIYRVWFYVFTQGTVNGEKYEHRGSPVMRMVAAEDQAHVGDALPDPEPGPAGTVTRNVISQVDQKHKDVLYDARVR